MWQQSAVPRVQGASVDKPHPVVLLQDAGSKADGKKQQKQPQKGSSGAAKSSAGSSGDGGAAKQHEAAQPAIAKPASEVAYPADKSKAAAGDTDEASESAADFAATTLQNVGADSGSAGGGVSSSVSSKPDAAAGKLPGSMPVTEALKTGINRLSVPQHALTVAGAVVVLALWCLAMRRRRLRLFGQRRGSGGIARRFSP